MAIIELSVNPIGTGGTSVSHYVAGAARVLEGEPGIKYELTPMGTIIEGDLDHCLALAQRMHEAVFATGAMRVVTLMKIDDRRDKALSMQGKLDSVRKKLGHDDKGGTV